MHTDIRRKNVFVGLSGGVDSAVSAALLQRAGAHVTGVFIKGWYPPGMPCTWAADRRDAMRVAARLHIPFMTLDASAEYKKSVIDYLLAEYAAGRTPNPDIMCNRAVKFGAFYRFAKAHGADAIATGHYQSGEKDQRYFLWAVPEEALAFTLFPLKGMEKSETRALAQKYQLPVATKRDSQGVCFLGSISVEEFLRGEFGSTPGKAVDEAGNRIGEHDGALLHTLGERIALRDAPPGPWFVQAKDVRANELTVGNQPMPRDTGAHVRTRFSDANWFGPSQEVTHAQYRYRGPYVAGHVDDANRFVATEPLTELPTPGQSIVFYSAARALLGGGIIAA